ncbi:hypothetical protein [Metallosphaera hakonensis]|uniref:hypothetical protein n=1 Tax=Metallosphaera hakonensis TaxID=79601 RepID=UPI0006D02CDC|nr:hypothetical protein [Metallosphaera hakonensis]
MAWYLLLDGQISLRGVLSSLRSRSGWYILLSYLSVHYLAYSLLLDKILGISLSTGFGLTYAPMESIGLNNGIGLLFSPSISMGNSQFYLDLSFFSLVMGLVIGLLVLGNIAELRRLRGLRRDVSLVGLPLAGIVSGSTCCISIASILSYYAPIVVTGMALVLLDVGYVGLPFLTAIFLWLNYKNLKHVNIVLVEKLKWGPQLK